MDEDDEAKVTEILEMPLGHLIQMLSQSDEEDFDMTIGFSDVTVRVFITLLPEGTMQ